MRLSLISIFTIMIQFSVSAQDSDTIKYISVEPYDFHLQYLITEPALILDVRMPFEYRHNRIKDAINVPSVKDLTMAADTISRDCALFLYCTDDFRSKRASEICCELGFKKVYNLEGGIIAWRKDGFPVDKKRIRKRDQ